VSSVYPWGITLGDNNARIIHAMPRMVALVAGGMVVAAAAPLAWGGRVVDARLHLPVWSESPRHQGRTRISAYAQIHSKPVCEHRREAKLYFQRRAGGCASPTPIGRAATVRSRSLAGCVSVPMSSSSKCPASGSGGGTPSLAAVRVWP
jgi:hypothetical protein